MDGANVQNARAPDPCDWLSALPSCADCLFEDQREEIGRAAQAIAEGCRRVLVQAPTGMGKTHMISAIAGAAVVARLRVLILATRTRLIRQLHERLGAFEIPHGVVAAPLPQLVNYGARVQIASVDTLHRRAVIGQRMPLPSADVVIFDEAHLAAADSRLGILDRYPDAIRFGFSATPARKSGRGLGQVFDRLILGPSIRELIHRGRLVPPRVFSTPIVSEADLKALPKDATNDYATEALGELLTRPRLVGDVVSNWARIANGKRTLVFAVHKAHGAALVQDFLRNGIAAELLTDQDEEDTREEAIRRLESGATRVLVNCFLMSYGVDIPSLECVVLARPTRSLAMYLQMVGRGLRNAPGKGNLIVLDHGRVIESLGLPQSDFPWTLDEGRNVNAEARKAQAKSLTQEKARSCPECAAVWLTSETGHACPECGWKPALKPKDVRASEAELQELAEREDFTAPTDAPAVHFHREALGWYAQRWPDRWREKPKSARWWAWLQTVDRFKVPASFKPPAIYWEHAPEVPSREIAGWLLSRQIRWVKGKARAA